VGVKSKTLKLFNPNCNMIPTPDTDHLDFDQIYEPAGIKILISSF
jgi:hypothetical protein